MFTVLVTGVYLIKSRKENQYNRFYRRVASLLPVQRITAVLHTPLSSYVVCQNTYTQGVTLQTTKFANSLQERTAPKAYFFQWSSCFCDALGQYAEDQMLAEAVHLFLSFRNKFFETFRCHAWQ
mmetsp:Transcript_5906/g.6791  ORF Transcript_5906/g.6791 Transcript_5906/m.6791 type:complete len:124 (-) Transcript_5906:68-439(-)